MIFLLSKDPAVSDILSGFSVTSYTDPVKLLSDIRTKAPGLLILDCDLTSGAAAVETYKNVKQTNPRLPVIMISEALDFPLAVRSAKLGADFLHKPLDPDEVKISIAEALARQKKVVSIEGLDRIHWLAGSSVLHSVLLQEIEAAASDFSDINLISEPGIDKKSAAELIHQNSVGRGSFKTLGLASFSREEEEALFWTTLESLFSAKDDEKKELRLKTLYLTDFERLTRHFKESLLQFLKTRRQKPQYDQGIRIIIESESALEELDGFGKIHLPALRFRREDLPEIVSAYLQEYQTRYARPLKGISLDIIPLLVFYDFPGNFMELEALLKSGVLREKSECLSLSRLPLTGDMLRNIKRNELMQKNVWHLQAARKQLEKMFFKFTIENCQNDVDLAAKFLDIPRRAFNEKINSLDFKF